MDSYVSQISGNIVDKEKVIELGVKLCEERKKFRLEVLGQTGTLEKVFRLFNQLSNRQVRWDFVFELSMKQSDRLRELQHLLPSIMKRLESSLERRDGVEIDLLRQIDSTGIRTVHLCRWHAEEVRFRQTGLSLEDIRINELYIRFVDAKHRLARTGLMLVVKIAHQFRNSAGTLMERIQDGNVGVMIAAEKYNPALGWTFTAYASHWIKQCIFLGLRRREFIHVPAQQSNRIRSCKTEVSEFSQGLLRKMTAHEQSELLNQSNVSEPMLAASFRTAISLEQLPGFVGARSVANDVDETCGICPLTMLERKESQIAISSAIDGLDANARQVLELRFGLNGESEHSFAGIGRRLGLSHHRVNQILAKSFSQLQSELAGFE